MPTPKKGPRLGGRPAHQTAIFANLATSLFEHGSITTTEAKARMLRPFAERLITKARRGDLHNRRQVLAVIRDKSVVHVLFTEIGPRFAERPGGYTRITKIGPRKGDNAPMAVIQLVEAEFTPRATTATPSAGAAKKAAATPPADDTAAEAPDDTADEAAAADVSADQGADETGASEGASTDADAAADEPADGSDEPDAAEPDAAADDAADDASDEAADAADDESK